MSVTCAKRVLTRVRTLCGGERSELDVEGQVPRKASFEIMCERIRSVIESVEGERRELDDLQTSRNVRY